MFRLVGVLRGAAREAPLHFGKFSANELRVVNPSRISSKNSLNKRTLFTAQRAVVFPPDGRRPLFLYAVFILSSAVWEVYSFYSTKDAVNDLGRKARSGEAVFGPSQTAKALLLLDAYANSSDPLWGDSGDSESDFPNMLPRITRAGGFEALFQALQSSDHKVVLAASELAKTFSSRPHGAKMLMNTSETRNGIISAFEKAVNSPVCKDCGGSSALEIYTLISALKNCLPYYPFGADPELDARLKSALSILSTRAATFAEKHRDGLVVDPEFLFPFGSDFGHPWLPPTELTQHDFHWYLHIADSMLDLGVQACFKNPSGSAGPNAALSVVLEPTLANLNRMFQAGLFDEEQEVYLGLVCMEAMKRSKTLDPALLQSIEVFSKSIFFRHSWSRKFAKGLLDHADFLSTVTFAGALGYLWGVARTLFALRDVSPPVSEIPSIKDQPLSRVPGQTATTPASNARAWRWKLSRQYGGRATLGAIGFTLWAHLATTTFGNDVWISSDFGQTAYFAGKVLAGVTFAGYLFKNAPFFFFPSVMARLTDISNAEPGSVHISFGPRGITSGGDDRSRRDGKDGGKWT